MIGKSGYEWFQAMAKIKDIKGRLIDEAEMEVYPMFLQDDSNCIDIGANYAYHTHRLAKICPNGKIIAFEPVPFTYRVCKKIIRYFSLKNVLLYQKGVGEKNGSIEFDLPLQDSGMASAGQAHVSGRNNDMEGKEQHYKFSAKELVSSEVIALDEFPLELDAIEFIKMDIEGYEYFALKGMKQILEKFKPIILLEINPFFLKGFDINEADFSNLVSDLGYRLYRYDQGSGKLYLFQSEYQEDNYFMIHKSTKNQAILNLIEL